MDPGRGKHMRLDQFSERQQRGRAGPDMIGHGGDRQLDPFARQLLALPVERLVIGVFVDKDHRQQARPGEAPGDRMEGRRRLSDLLAGAAAELLPHMFGDEHLTRHHVQRLGDILADLREFGAAAARAAGRRGMHDAPARQVSGEVPARPGPREALHRDVGRLSLGRILAGRRGQFLQLQFQLIEQALAALRARAEQLAPHLGDHQLQVLDQGLGAGQLGTRLDQCRFQRILVVRNMISCRRHKSIESQSPLIRWSSQRMHQQIALTPPPMAASCAADDASRCLRADSRAAPT